MRNFLTSPNTMRTLKLNLETKKAKSTQTLKQDFPTFERLSFFHEDLNTISKVNFLWKRHEVFSTTS